MALLRNSSRIRSHVRPRNGADISSGVTTGLSQGKNLAEGGPLVTVGRPTSQTQKKVKKWQWISRCGCPY